MTRVLLLLMLCFAAVPLQAQDAAPGAAPADPIVSVTIKPPRVIVGQSAVLQVDVLAPNYMTKPPVMPDFQLRNAVTRAGSTVNMSEQRNGVSYAGVRFEFLIYPQEAGRYAMTGQNVTITYAADPPNVREAVRQVPEIAFEAVIPNGAESLDPFVSATKLTLRQDIQPSSPALKVGDSITRSVHIEADGTPSILLPPARFTPVDGTKAYAAQPDLQDRLDRRTDALSATRTDQTTYMLLRPGDLTLPGLEVQWWNVRDQKIERARIEPTTFQVAANPKLDSAPERNAAPSPRRILLFMFDHGRATLAILIAAALLAWFGPRLVRNALAWVRKRRALYVASEAHAFGQIRVAARRNDPATTYFAVLRWLRLFAPVQPSPSIKTLRIVAQDPALDRAIAALERRLYAAQPDDTAWSGRDLMKCLAVARHTLPARHSPHKPVLPASINPGDTASRYSTASSVS